MFCKLLIFAIVAVAVMHVQALDLRGLKEEESGPVAYEFHYSVHDPHTGDIKSQKEARKDDRVEGIYELIDSDGHRRIVKYKADDHNGFEAEVIREPTDIKIPQPAPAKLLAPKLLHY